MALLEEISAHLVAQGITPVTRDQLPDTPDTVVAIYQTPGFAPVHTQGGGGAGSAKLHQPGLQIIARGPRKDRAAARALAHQVLTTLDGLTSAVLSGCRYVSIFAQNAPHHLRDDENERAEYTCDFTVVKEPS